MTKTNNDSRIYPDRKPESSFHRFIYSLKWPLIIISLLFSLRYLLWRGIYTLNHQDMLSSTISIVLYAAELFGFTSILMFFVQTFKLTRHDPIELPEEKLPTVDVMVTIYTEPAEVLYRTLVACAALDYPREKLKVYICDDGGRDEIKKMAAEFGCQYLARTDHKHAKAGNLNNALKYSQGELIMILDCDHIPVRSFLRETVGFLANDPKLAFVQTPHHFYNPDCHQKNLLLHNELTHEQDLFFQVLQPGRDHTNSAIFAGSAALFRRSALEEIGGFRVEVAIEDLHTGMELHSRGYKSLFYNRILVGGLSPETYIGYLTQRNRWSKGGVQLFMLDNPLFKSGLSLMQRLNYSASLQYFFSSVPRLVYLVVPLSFLLFNYNPIVSEINTLVWYFLPHYLFAHFAFQTVGREYRSPFWSDVYDTGTAFLLSFTVFATLLRPEKLVFQVTPKGAGSQPQDETFHWRYVMPHILLMLLLIVGLVKGAYMMSKTGFTFTAYTLSAMWALFNLLLLACSIEVAREHPQQRSAYRLNRRIPCRVSFGGVSVEGETVDVSEGGALVQLPSHHEMPDKVSLTFMGSVKDDNAYPADVIRTIWVKGIGDMLALKFPGLSESGRRNIILQMFSAPESWDKVRRPLTDSFSAITHIATSLVRKRIDKADAKHKIARFKADVPCDILAGGQTIAAYVENFSRTGAALRAPLAPDLSGLVIELFLTAKKGTMQIKAKVVKKLSADQEVARYGLQFISPASVDPHQLVRDTQDAADTSTKEG